MIKSEGIPTIKTRPIQKFLVLFLLISGVITSTWFQRHNPGPEPVLGILINLISARARWDYNLLGEGGK